MFSKEIANSLSKDIFYMIDQLKDEVVKKQFMIDNSKQNMLYLSM